VRAIVRSQSGNAPIAVASLEIGLKHAEGVPVALTEPIGHRLGIRLQARVVRSHHAQIVSLISLVNTELYPSTVNGAGIANFDWLAFGSAGWVANPAPPRRFERFAEQLGGAKPLLATRPSPAAILPHVAPKLIIR
jgi:hypothetical protein